jgi:uroporphyrinogen decarboxylase
MKSFYEADRISEVRRRHPDHCLIFGTHIGPFTATFMAMGFEHFFISLFDNPSFVHAVLEARTEWCVAMYQEALAHGAEVLVLGEDAGSSQGSMISPVMWREFIYPYHCRIVEALDAPLIWHSDGNVMSLLPMAIEAGFIGFHGMDPMAGMDLGTVKKEFGRDLVLVGNVDVRVLCGTDLSAVRHEVDRCLEAIGSEGGYMIATCNSIFEGMNPEAVIEMFEYEGRSGL